MDSAPVVSAAKKGAHDGGRKGREDQKPLIGGLKRHFDVVISKWLFDTDSFHIPLLIEGHSDLT